jgi:transcriptional regulator with XRE-family HTH domain
MLVAGYQLVPSTPNMHPPIGGVKGSVDQIVGTDAHALKKRLKKRLLDLDVKLKEVAERTGDDYKNVQRWVSGSTTMPADFLARVVAKVDVDPRWLLLGPEANDQARPTSINEPRAAYDAGGAVAEVASVGDVERLAILRLLSFVSQVVASGPVSSTELLDDLRALATMLHVQQLAGDTLVGGTPPVPGERPGERPRGGGGSANPPSPG